MKEHDSRFLHLQAEACIALSRSTFDLTLAGRLRAMADEFHRKASEWDEEANGLFLHGGNSVHASDVSQSRNPGRD